MSELRPDADSEHDAWLREALRHAPDAGAVPPIAVRDAILAEARAATATSLRATSPSREGAAHASPWQGVLAFWHWLARPPVAAGFASVMAATLVGMMWWGRPLDDALPKAPPFEQAETRKADAPAATRDGANTAAAPKPAGEGTQGSDLVAVPQAARAKATSEASASTEAAAPAAAPAPVITTVPKVSPPEAATISRAGPMPPPAAVPDGANAAGSARRPDTVEQKARPTEVPTTNLQGAAPAPAPATPFPGATDALSETRREAPAHPSARNDVLKQEALPSPPIAAAQVVPPSPVPAPVPVSRPLLRQRAAPSNDEAGKDAAALADAKTAPSSGQIAADAAPQPFAAQAPAPLRDAFAAAPRRDAGSDASHPLAPFLADLDSEREASARLAGDARAGAGSPAGALRRWLMALDDAAAGRWQLAGAADAVDAADARDKTARRALHLRAGENTAVLRIDGTTVFLDRTIDGATKHWRAVLAPASAAHLRATQPPSPP